MKNSIIPLCVVLSLLIMISGCTDNEQIQSEVPGITQPIVTAPQVTRPKPIQLSYESCVFMAADLDTEGFDPLKPDVIRLGSFEELLKYEKNADYSDECLNVFRSFTAQNDPKAVYFALKLLDPTQTSRYFVRDAVLWGDSLDISLERIDMEWGVDAVGEWLILIAIDGSNYTDQPIHVELVESTVEAEAFEALGAHCYTTVGNR